MRRKKQIPRGARDDIGEDPRGNLPGLLGAQRRVQHRDERLSGERTKSGSPLSPQHRG
ncbi:MAG: hypothetical protein HYX73_10765 [Acidobacteria bacterium]|nr:hypothetical protein [Acidobacteriota bacterium]